MKPPSLRTLAFLATDVALVAVSVMHIPSLKEFTSVPFIVSETEGKVVITQILQPPLCPDLRVGDELVHYLGRPLVAISVMEFPAQTASIGQWVDIEYRRAGKVSGATVQLVPEIDLTYLVLVLFIGIITWCVAVFVLLMRPRELAASALHWALISMATVVVIVSDEVVPSSSLGYWSSVLFFISYGGVATSFLFFITIFPHHKRGPLWSKILLVFAPIAGLLVPIIYHHFRAFSLLSIEEFLMFRRWFTLFHVALLTYFGVGVFNFIHSYIRAESSAERRQLKWIVWGLCIGPTPFLLLTLLPGFIAPAYAIPEEYTLAFLIVIPVAFAISCIKYHALDVEVVISRTSAYAVALGVLVGIYVLVVGAVASLVGETTASTGAAVLVALLFQPVRTMIQHVVDRRFFRIRYNYREAQRKINEDLKYCLDVHQLAEVVVNRIDEVIPTERIGFFVLKQPGNRVHLETHTGFTLLQGRSVGLDTLRLKTQLRLPVAIDGRVEPGIHYESADEEVFKRWGMTLVVSMLSEKLDILGFLVLGDKKSGARFTSEDVDLLDNIGSQAGMALERLTLQQQLILKKAEAQRLEELNRLKSDFVSYVSHELKTPLTSIKMFSELLQPRQRTKDGKAREYLHIIEGEADRLDRMVTTILDSAKIEQGVKEYQFSEVDLRKVAGHVLDILKYQLDKDGFRVTFKPGRNPLFIYADADAVAQAMINLISNAIKYSSHTRKLRVSLSHDVDSILCSVQDRGVGISAEAVPHLFEKFYRDPHQSRYVQGVGLGLPLVKHIMDAHGGRVDVKSELGKGSTFALSFPITRLNGEAEKKDTDR